jgi:hypothetical protein
MMPAAVCPQERVFKSPPVPPNVVARAFLFFSNGRLTIGDSMRELAFADYFAMTFPPFTQSLLLLRAPFAPAELITSGAFCSAALHSIAPGFVCTFCRRFVLGLGEKQNAPANRSQTRKK